MKEINIVKISFFVWLRFQLVIVGFGLLLSIFSFQADSVAFLAYFELINAAFSAIGCISYGLLLYVLIKTYNIQYQSDLKLILYHAGWLNVVLLFMIYAAIALATNELNKGVFAVLGFALAVILVGQIAIYWTVEKLQINDLNSEKLDNLLNELGAEKQEI